MSERNALLVMPALTASAGTAGSFVLTRKFVDGAAEYARRWPGPVVVWIEQVQRADSNLDHIEVDPDDLPFALRWLPADQSQLDAVLDDAAVVLATLVDKHLPLVNSCARKRVPLAYISEYSVLTRRQIIRAETSNPILRWRRERWTTQLERRYEQAVKSAAGVQCNGTPTFEAYRALSRNPLLYFDTRVRADQLADQGTIDQRTREMLAGGPLRLAFSGRLIPMKGANHLPLIAAELKKRGVPFTMEICGGGILEPNLRSSIQRLGLGDQVRLRGVLDFETELMPLIARHVDLFICPHPQGDPSCTYLETMSCGTPITGYDNEALRGLTDLAKVGWCTALGKPGDLAGQIARLHHNRQELVSDAIRSLRFAAQHTFETTMKARVDHLLSCAAPRKVPVSA